MLGSIGAVSILVGSLPLALLGGYGLLCWQQERFSALSWISLIGLALLALAVGARMWNRLESRYRHHVDSAGVATEGALRKLVWLGVSYDLRSVLISGLGSLIMLYYARIPSGWGQEMLDALLLPLLGGMFSLVVWVLMVIPAFFLLLKRP